MCMEEGLQANVYPALVPVNNGLKQRDTLYTLFLHFTLEYAISKVQENNKGLTCH
jgi:hypothetical protein